MKEHEIDRDKISGKCERQYIAFLNKRNKSMRVVLIKC